MNHNHIFHNSTDALPRLLANLEIHGQEVGSRDGRTKELTHLGITLTKPLDRELLVAKRKHNLAAQIAETMWVLSGRDDIAWLSHYLPRADQFSDDGIRWRGAYGPRLRAWHGQVDQIAYVVETLKASDLSRQAVAMLWDPEVDTQPGKDRACNNWLSFSVRHNELDLHVSVRSNDVMWGWSGINVFEWSALQEIVASLVGVNVGSLHFSVTSFHLYERHWEKAQEIIDTNHADLAPDPSPRFSPVASTLRYLDDVLIPAWFMLEERIRNGENITHLINDFPEPMLRSWLRVIEWWWTADPVALAPLHGTRLGKSATFAVQPKPVQPKPDFLSYVHDLHSEKHAAYGDSWKRRGEMLGVLANIARKVDRLGGGETSDETSTDTAIDLLVYLGKYRLWLSDFKDETCPYEWAGEDPAVLSDYVEPVTVLFRMIEEEMGDGWLAPQPSMFEQALTIQFEELERLVNAGEPRAVQVDQMLVNAYRLARTLWSR